MDEPRLILYTYSSEDGDEAYAQAVFKQTKETLGEPVSNGFDGTLDASQPSSRVAKWEQTNDSIKVMDYINTELKRFVNIQYAVAGDAKEQLRDYIAK